MELIKQAEQKKKQKNIPSSPFHRRTKWWWWLWCWLPRHLRQHSIIVYLNLLSGFSGSEYLLCVQCAWCQARQYAARHTNGMQFKLQCLMLDVQVCCVFVCCVCWHNTVVAFLNEKLTVLFITSETRRMIHCAVLNSRMALISMYEVDWLNVDGAD